MPRMYDDIWTASKGMYKLEPAIEDGGEVIIYAPHIDEISYSHGRVLDQIGYHVRDYFVEAVGQVQTSPLGRHRAQHTPEGVGTYDAENKIETPHQSHTGHEYFERTLRAP